MPAKSTLTFKHFAGEHCETTATGNLLYQQGLRLSEPMMFGLGEGLGFIFLNLQSLNLPFVGGRTKPFEITTKLCANLGVKLEAVETSSKAKAADLLLKAVEAGKCVGLQLDSYYLPYFSSKIHFAGHFVAVTGIEGESAWVIDTKQQGAKHRVPLADLEKARFEKGPMSAKARMWTIETATSGAKATAFSEAFLKTAIHKAVRNNAEAYLKPDFKGMSFFGIEKLAKSLPTWLEVAKDPKEDLALSAMMMERAGTGGSIFRCFYRDFLEESLAISKSPVLKKAAVDFRGIADDWKTVAGLIEHAGARDDQTSLTKASTLCLSLATREKSAMEQLTKISK